MRFNNNESRENISELNYIILNDSQRLNVEMLHRTSKVRRTSGSDRIVAYYHLIELRHILWRCYSYYDYSFIELREILVRSTCCCLFNFF
jgi:hypothetical protein